MSDELYHHGIDGQRWGVQHGPPYPLSRAQHRAVVKQAKKEAKSKKATEKRNITYKKSGKYAKRMSDEDLNATIDRLKREETYRNLVSKDKEAKTKAKEEKAASNQGSNQKNQNGQQKSSFRKEVRQDAIKTAVHNLINSITNQVGLQKGKLLAKDMERAYDEKHKAPETDTSKAEKYKQQVEEYFNRESGAYTFVPVKKKKKSDNSTGKTLLLIGGTTAAMSTVMPKLLKSNVIENITMSDMNNYIIDNIPAEQLLRITG